MTGATATVSPLSALILESARMPRIEPPATSLPSVRLPTHTIPSYEQLVIGKTSSLTSAIEEFRGIPYGLVPRRWEHSLLRPNLPHDIFDASCHGPKCPQPAAPNNSDLYQSHLEFPDVDESEIECLNLWIIRPTSGALVQIGYDSVDTALPVYFYIHGGGFGFGAGTDPIWDPTRLLDQSIAIRKPFIAVVINYRLNLFGFAASSSIIASQTGRQKGCNFGIHDQKIALKWVSQNISSFGGDPHSITIGGQSAGGCSVHLHVMDAKSSSNPPLFKRAIIQSGALRTFGISPVPISVCEGRLNALSNYFELGDETETHRTELLRKMPAANLVKAGEDLGWMVFYVANDGLTIRYLSQTDWLVQFDHESASGPQERVRTEPVNVLIGDTESEGSVFIEDALPKIQTYQQAKTIFQDAYSSESDASAALQVYGIRPEVSVLGLHQSLVEFITDVTFGYSIFSAHRELSTRAGNNIQYQRPSTSQLYRVKFGNPFPGPRRGDAHHCVDLIYLFDAFHHDLDAEDQRHVQSTASISNSMLRDEIQAVWIQFIAGDVNDSREDKILVFGQDRTPRTESLTDDPEWMEKRRKFETIGQHLHEAAKVMEKVIELGNVVVE